MTSTQWVLSHFLVAFGENRNQTVYYMRGSRVSYVHQDMNVRAQGVISRRSYVFPWPGDL